MYINVMSQDVSAALEFEPVPCGLNYGDFSTRVRVWRGWGLSLSSLFSLSTLPPPPYPPFDSGTCLHAPV